jgi:hypothetical protein
MFHESIIRKFMNKNIELRQEVLDVVKISDYNNLPNHYLFDLSKYKKKKHKNLADFESFFFLDLDHKTHIKNLHSFSYNNVNINQNSQNYHSNNITANAMSNTKNEDGEEFSSNKFIRKNLRKERSVKDIFNDKYTGAWIRNTSEKPKWDLKFTFEMDANDTNLINEFVDPDPKYLQNSEYFTIDYFLNMEINQENYNKIFDINLNDNMNLFEEYFNNSSNEFKDDFLQRFNNTIPKKKEQKKKELNDMEYLIFDTKENQFYKKLKVSSEKYTRDEDSPKVRVKVKKIPMKILDDHY